MYIYLPIDTTLTFQDLQLQVHYVRITDLTALYNICKCIVSASSFPQPEFELGICYIQVRCFVTMFICVVFHQVYWVGIFQVLILNLSSCKCGFECESQCYDRQLLAKLCLTSTCIRRTTWSYVYIDTLILSVLFDYFWLFTSIRVPFPEEICTLIVYRTFSTGTGFSFSVGTRCGSRGRPD